MRRLVGLDLTGWHDAACRNYGTDDETDEAGVRRTVDGGLGSVVVDLDEAGLTRVGGPQAIISPIGRGGGWGAIGKPERRRPLRTLWQSLMEGGDIDARAADLRASIDALAVRAERALLCVPDRSGLNESCQQWLLRASNGPRRVRVSLLWRSVAVALDVLDGELLPEARPGLRLLTLCHDGEGLEAQAFVLRALEEDPSRLAPERAATGRMIGAQWGLDSLLADMDARVRAANPPLAEFRAEDPRLPLELLLADLPHDHHEIVRRDNQDWLTVRAPQDRSLSAMPDLSRYDLVLELSPPPDVVLVASPLADHHLERLSDQVRACLPSARIVVVDCHSAARGALHAAERIAHDIPHYLDRLDPIALAVMTSDGPAFEDLIPLGATVPGNREYVSRPITGMAWSSGMTQANFYIRKGETEIRHWRTEPIAAPPTAQRLEIRLRQTPAQGWAVLSVTAPDWEPLRSSPIVLDWGGKELTVETRTAEEILASLEKPLPVVPRRIVHEAHLGLWDGSFRSPGLSVALAGFDIDDFKSISRLAQTLTASQRIDESGNPGGPAANRVVYSVSTDGDLPGDVPARQAELLDAALSAVDLEISRRLGSGEPFSDNALLRCATWAFGRCPPVVKKHMVEAFFATRAGKPHPLTAPRQGSKTLTHGLGRSLSEGPAVVAVIRSIVTEVFNADALGALAALLSRPVATPLHLRDDDVAAVGKLLVRLFAQIRRESKFGVILKYTLLGTAGLLRVREVDPGALVASTSKDAACLLDEVIKTLDAGRKIPQFPGRDAKLRILEDLIRLLEGDGGSPDILIAVDRLEDD